jgi:hypothetical protein
MADERKQCAHTGCLCPADEDSKYCSAYCSGAGDHAELICDCGCPDCQK